jgi:hypothetical protein
LNNWERFRNITDFSLFLFADDLITSNFQKTFRTIKSIFFTLIDQKRQNVHVLFIKCCSITFWHINWKILLKFGVDSFSGSRVSNRDPKNWITANFFDNNITLFQRFARKKWNINDKIKMEVKTNMGFFRFMVNL